MKSFIILFDRFSSFLYVVPIICTQTELTHPIERGAWSYKSSQLVYICVYIRAYYYDIYIYGVGVCELVLCCCVCFTTVQCTTGGLSTR